MFHHTAAHIPPPAPPAHTPTPMFLTKIPVGQISLPSVSFISAEKSGRGDVLGISGTRGDVLGTEEQKECGPSRTAVQIKTLSDVRDLGPSFLRSEEGKGKKSQSNGKTRKAETALQSWPCWRALRRWRGRKEAEKERQEGRKSNVSSGVPVD